MSSDTDSIICNWEADPRDELFIDLARRNIPNQPFFRSVVNELNESRSRLILPALTKILKAFGWPTAMSGTGEHRRITFRGCLLETVQIFHRGRSSMAHRGVTILTEDARIQCDVGKKEGRYQFLAFLMNHEAAERKLAEGKENKFREVEEDLKKWTVWREARKYPGKLRLSRARRTRATHYVIQEAEDLTTTSHRQEALPGFNPWATFRPTKLSFCETNPDISDRAVESSPPSNTSPSKPPNPHTSPSSMHSSARRSKTPSKPHHRSQNCRIQKPNHSRMTKKSISRHGRDSILKDVSNWTPCFEDTVRPLISAPPPHHLCHTRYHWQTPLAHLELSGRRCQI
ncbi:hypothetical protein BU16DRAFT_556649 [Lophium mytilinum]|uniref:Uncharacterized protein n=1 Tax=Lophium mytilinum TaxID=390894 RepID=A0A6A6R6S2_9PEZI|nr:hypothetical protein BU16DRAFT_556649 [Lophium mytilinum]